MPRAFYATRLSENMAATPEGFLLCKDAVLARTGMQQYAVSELPEEAVKDISGNIVEDGTVQLFRPAEEVFSPDSISSMEGKPVTLDHPSGKRFVSPENVKELQRGHVQNVRRGKEPLPDGEWPLIGDLLITHPDLIQRVKGGLRELSAGYDYRLVNQDSRLTQTDIVHNHIAVVEHARAGTDVRIQDAAPAIGSNKEKSAMKDNNLLRRILGLGLKAFAQDAKPEELAEAAEAVKEHGEHEADDKRADDKCADDKRADDKVTRPITDARKQLHDTLDAFLNSMDEPSEAPIVPKKFEKAELEPEEARDLADRKRLHSALDRFMKDRRSNDKRADDAHAGDVDLRELRDLLDEYLKEEEQEPAHQQEEAGDEALPIEETNLKKDFDNPVPVNDEETSIIEPIEEKREDRKGSARDAAEAAFLRSIRPAIASSRDSKAVKLFNARLRSLTGKTRVETEASYGGFMRAAAARDSKSNADGPSETQSRYAALHGRMNVQAALDEYLKERQK